MRATVLPVSGGSFAAQLGLLQLMLESGLEEPELVLAASGGGVAAYAALCGEWTSPGISRVAGSLHNSLFARRWLSSSPLSCAVGFFEGTFYREGEGLENVLRTYLNRESATRSEIWLSTCNIRRHKASLFCNLGPDESQLKEIEYLDESLTQCLPPVYLGGNLSAIARAILASASIPTVVPPQIIEGEPHVDGGLYYASPLAPLQPVLAEQAGDEPLHLLYVNGCDLERGVSFLSKPARCDREGAVVDRSNLLDNGFLAAGGLVRGQLLADRLAGCQLVRGQGGGFHSALFHGTPENLELLEDFWAAASRSMVEVFPRASPETDALAGGSYAPPSVDITNFSGRDVLRVMEEARRSATLRLCWKGEEDLPGELGFY